MQSPSFLAHQRHLETGQGRSNCETLFAMRKIPGDSQIGAKLDAVVECAPAGGQFEFVVLTPCVGLLENRSHGQTSFT
jgi:hypothetical protein